MATERQIAANRRNALKSTGPRTQAGRERSRMNAVKHGLSRKLPPAEAPDPRVLPLARALVGEGVTSPVALAAAEEIAVASLTLSSIRLMRASLMGGKGAAVSEADARMGPEWSCDLVQLERFERQAFTRRNRAVRRLDHALAQSSHHAAGGS